MTAKVNLAAGEKLKQLVAAHNPAIILGSKSSARRLLLGQIARECGGFDFTRARYTLRVGLKLLPPPGCETGAIKVAAADIDEKQIRDRAPRNLVLSLGHAKAAALVKRRREEQLPEPPSLLITGDQVCVHADKILEKPESEAEVREFIRGYGEGTPAKTVSSVVITNEQTGETWEGVDEVEVTFQPLPSETVDVLIAEGDVFHCAGALMIEHPLVQPHILEMRGGTEESVMESVMGLPSQLVVDLLCQSLVALTGRQPADPRGQ